ncbi:sensor histidine kinase [Carboxylicivirga taeanensis]|uniref:sensor histidine kinase n=1 Tax=Carboxylicivirga taeanensis TaxID=1416875 RepID=UPI003F6DC5FD
MNHPIFSETRIFKLYGFVWLIVALVYAFINAVVYQLPFNLAILDSLIVNVLMFFMGLSIWYPIRYIDREKDWLSLLIQYLIAGIILVGSWLLMAYGLFRILVAEDAIDLLFNTNAFIIRGAFGGLLFIVFVMVYYMFIFYNEVEEKNRQHEQMNRLLRETELNALKAQLNPHFLFNSLNSVSALTITDADAAREMINKLSEFMRYSLKKNEAVLLPLSEELKNIGRYLDIEKVRFGERLLCESHVPQNCKAHLVPVLILQPLFENAVKHGVYESTEPVTIRTYCRMIGDELEFSIINNHDADAISHKGEGVGLANVRERLQLIYNRSDLLSINSENHYFEVVLRIP